MGIVRARDDSCNNASFHALRAGDRVTFEVGQGPKGPRAVTDPSPARSPVEYLPGVLLSGSACRPDWLRWPGRTQAMLCENGGAKIDHSAAG